MSEQIIYIVTSGVYSDYRIVAVFSNKTAALEFIQGRGDPKDCRIEEYPLNTEVCLNTYYVMLYADRAKDPWFICEIPYDPDAGTVSVRRVRGRETVYHVNVEAKNKKSALKIANEKIMMAIAKGK